MKVGDGKFESRLPATAETFIKAQLSQTEVTDASLLLVEISIPMARRLASTEPPTGKFEGQDLTFFPESSASGGWEKYGAVVAIPYGREPGPGLVKVEALGQSLVLPFQVKEGKYRSEVLKVDPDKVDPPEAVIPRILKEMEEVKSIYAQRTHEKYWKGKFRIPLTKQTLKRQVTSPFGTKRTYNGELKSFHSGLDLRASTGTPIRAPASGKVAMAQNLYFTGNTVLLDHGYGVYTLYAHMSRLKVKVGQVVKPKQVLGLAGSTGRVTGPHLHWGAIVNGEKVNPMELVQVLQ